MWLERGFEKLVSFLNPGIVSEAKTKFPANPIYMFVSIPCWFARQASALLTEPTLVLQIIEGIRGLRTAKQAAKRGSFRILGLGSPSKARRDEARAMLTEIYN